MCYQFQQFGMNEKGHLSRNAVNSDAPGTDRERVLISGVS